MKHHEPVIIGCSCAPDAYGFQLYVNCPVGCGNCHTWYMLTRDGHVRSQDQYHREPGPSHAVNIEWPA